MKKWSIEDLPDDVVCKIWQTHMTTHVLQELLNAPIMRRLHLHSHLLSHGGERLFWISHHRFVRIMPDARWLKAVVFSHDVFKTEFHVGGHVMETRFHLQAGQSCAPIVCMPIFQLKYHAIGVTVASSEAKLKLTILTQLANVPSAVCDSEHVQLS